MINPQNDEFYIHGVIMDKILVNRLRWAGHLIRIGEDYSAWKLYKSNIDGGKENVADPESERRVT